MTRRGPIYGVSMDTVIVNLAIFSKGSLDQSLTSSIDVQDGGEKGVG